MLLAVHEHEKINSLDAVVGNGFAFFVCSTVRHDLCWPSIVCVEALYFSVGVPLKVNLV